MMKFNLCKCLALAVITLSALVVTCSVGREAATAELTDKPLLDLRGPTASDLKKLIPLTSDGKIERILRSGAIVYDRKSMPAVYQDTATRDPWFYGIHSIMVNVSGNKTEPFGNPNREFPWAHTAGTDEQTQTILLAQFPDLIEVKREVLKRSNEQNLEGQATVWTYPVGTKFVEIMIFKDKVYEMRLREKDSKGWLPTVYRPFTISELERHPEWKKQTATVKMKSSHPNRIAINVDVTAVSYSIPAPMIPVPFPDSDRPIFHPDNGTQSNGETFTFLGSGPENYKGGVSVSRENCMQCHQDTLKHADDFDANRDWYARIRGSDGIFSFHPFALESIAGDNHKAKPIRFRKELLPYLKVLE
jgi:hypothetical protein